MKRILLLALAGALLLAVCTPAPRPVRAGLDECAQCRMLLEDARFAAQALNQRGRAYTFDSIECLVAFLDEAQQLAADEVHSLWVAAFGEPDRWLAVEEAAFLHSEALRTPMGGNVTAHASTELARALAAELGGSVLDWDEARALLQRGGVGQHSHGHVAPAETGDVAARGAALVVGAGAAYATIGAALADARAGDVIRVLPGEYAEGTLRIDRGVVLSGEPGAIVRGGAAGSIVVVTADSVTVRGLTLRGAPVSHVADHAAILVDGARDCTLEHNRLDDNFFGIYLARSSGCRVRDNHITASGTRESSSGNGIHLWNTTDAVIENNMTRGHRDGIYLEHARRVRIAGNTSEDNIRYGLHFMFSSETAYEHNVFRRNGAGVAVMYSQRVRVHGNTFADNRGTSAYGLLLKDISDSEVTRNVFRRNTVALFTEGGNRLAVAGNEFRRNGWAVRVLANSQDNRFTDNNFIENAFDVTTNSRHSYSTFDGNYWSRYQGYDLTGDGYGDVPFRPVRLFGYIVERNPLAAVLLRGLFVDLLEVAERVAPVLTPEALVDERPRMREVVWHDGTFGRVARP